MLGRTVKSFKKDPKKHVEIATGIYFNNRNMKVVIKTL